MNRNARRRIAVEEIVEYLKTYPLFQQDKIPPMKFGVSADIKAAVALKPELKQAGYLIKSAVWSLLKNDGYYERWAVNKGAAIRYDLQNEPATFSYEKEPLPSPRARRKILSLNKGVAA